MAITTRPACYARLSESEWEDICKSMIVSLEHIAKRDGCIAAAWSIEVIKAQVERISDLETDRRMGEPSCVPSYAGGGGTVKYRDQTPIVTQVPDDPDGQPIHVQFARFADVTRFSDVTLCLSLDDAACLAENIQREIREIERAKRKVGT